MVSVHCLVAVPSAENGFIDISVLVAVVSPAPDFALN